MHKFELFKLKNVAQKAVIQGDHKYNIELYFSTLINAARKEFYEDSKITIDCFLKECFENALK